MDDLYKTVETLMDERGAGNVLMAIAEYCKRREADLTLPSDAGMRDWWAQIRHRVNWANPNVYSSAK